MRTRNRWMVELADTIGGSFLVLSLMGLLLWMQLHGPRLLAAGLGLDSLVLGIWFV